MSRRLEPLWRALREYADPRDTEAGWQRVLGPSWEAGRPLLRLTRDRACSWPCGRPDSLGCQRRVVEHPDGQLIGVCGDTQPRCDRVVLRGAQLGLLRLDIGLIADQVRVVLASDVISRHGRTVTVGPTLVGGASVAVAVTSAWTLLDLLQVADELAVGAPGALRLVLAPLGRSLAVSEHAALTRVGVEVLDLAACVQTASGSVSVDLSPWALQHRNDLAAADPVALLGDRFDLVLDPRRERAWLWGAEIDLRRRQRPRWLLQGLAQRPGQVVTRDELFDEVWPDKAPSEVEAWEVNLRSIKADLVKRLKPALEGRKAPIEAVQGSAVDGGYRLTLESERVCWWSDPVG